MRGGERESERASEGGRGSEERTRAHRSHLRAQKPSFVKLCLGLGHGDVGETEREGKTDARGKKGRREDGKIGSLRRTGIWPPRRPINAISFPTRPNLKIGKRAGLRLMDCGSLARARARSFFFSFDRCAGRRGPALVSIPAADLASGVSFRSIPGRPNHPRSLPSFSGKTTFAFSGHARARHRTEWWRGGRHRLLIPSAGPPADRDRDHGRAPAAAVHPPPPRGFLLDSVKVCLDRPRPQTATAMMISDHSNSNVTIAY